MISEPSREVVESYKKKVAPYPTIQDYFAAAVEKAEDRPFIVDGENDETVTYGETDSYSNAVANGLLEAGLTKGAEITVLLPNCTEFVYTVLGAQKVGIVPALVNVDLRGPGLRNSLDVPDSEVLVTVDSLFETQSDVIDEFDYSTTLVVERDGVDIEDGYQAFDRLLAEGDTSEPTHVEIGEDDPAAIPFSSGTTGLPKGMLMPHKNYVLWGEFLADKSAIRDGGGYHNCLPLFHQAGLWALHVAMAVNGYFTIFDSFSRTSFWDRVDQFDCQGTTLVSEMAQWLWDAPEQRDDGEHALEWAFIFGGPKQHRIAFERRFNMEYHIGYGMTETHTIVWSESPTGSGTDPLSDGRPFFHEVKIVDERDRELEADEIGEVVCRPLIDNIILKEYVGAYETTARKLRNCWYHTGDLARLDEDGYLFYEGKLDEYIRRTGENISHAEIETVVNEHEGVVESAVIGIPDPSVGEEIKIHVVPSDPDVDAAALVRSIVEFCVDQLADYQVPRYIEVLDEFPRTEATERVKKFELEQRGDRGLTEMTWDRTTDSYHAR